VGLLTTIPLGRGERKPAAPDEAPALEAEA
jgi:hypothetical protein